MQHLGATTSSRLGQYTPPHALYSTPEASLQVLYYTRHMRTLDLAKTSNKPKTHSNFSHTLPLFHLPFPLTPTLDNPIQCFACCKVSSALGPKSAFFRVFGLSGVTWLACPYQSYLAPARAEPSISTPSLSPRSPSPSPLLALAFCRHGLPSTPTPSQDTLQPPIDRPRVPAPRAIFVHQVDINTPGSLHHPIPPCLHHIAHTRRAPLSTFGCP